MKPHDPKCQQFPQSEGGVNTHMSSKNNGCIVSHSQSEAHNITTIQCSNSRDEIQRTK